MKWNWEQEKWPDFRYDGAQTEFLEKQFLLNSGRWLGVCSHLKDSDRLGLEIGLLSTEAQETSSIEGEIINRDSVQSSIQKQLGLKNDGRRVQPSERGIAELMVDVYQNYQQELSHEKLASWHEMVVRGRTDLTDTGCYRTDPDAMRVVSGPVHHPIVHFEAPPSSQVFDEMEVFLEWFNASRETLPITVRASLAHLHFESIHPFEDGNGRIGRAIAEFAISQSLQKPVLISLSQAISKAKTRYYDELAAASQGLEVSGWVDYFSSVMIEAQETSFQLVDFILGKAELLDRLHGQINERQEKALLRLFAEGLDGFQGGLSSSNYQRITGASTATTTRDLTDLVSKGALVKTGKQRNTRYWLPPEMTGSTNV